MNSFIVFTLLAGLVAMATADCDTAKCLAMMSKVDMQQPQKSCPEIKTALGCLRNVLDTCSLLGDNKASIEGPVNQAEATLNEHCGSSSGERVSQSVIMMVLLPIIVAIFHRV